MKRMKSYVRFRDDTGYELRCQVCLVYWPLADEFWERRTFTRCRACWAKYRNAKAREIYRSDPAVRERLRQYQQGYRAVAGDAKRLAAHDYYWSNAERERAKARLYYYQNRERILAYKREKYAQRRTERAA